MFLLFYPSIYTQALPPNIQKNQQAKNLSGMSNVWPTDYMLSKAKLQTYLKHCFCVDF